jgi:hypothetical protein
MAQLMIEVRFHGRPFTRDDAVDAGISQGLRRQRMQVDLVITQNAIESSTQSLDRPNALMVEPVGSELDGNALERLKRVRE